MNKWTRPFDRTHPAASPSGGRVASLQHFYFAFLSYSHADADEADWLHGELEKFRVPSTLVGKLTANGPIPKRLTPIFRDRHELAAADDLGEEIRDALAASRCLIVLCSPDAAKSKWTNAEIDTFKRLHPDGCIIAAVIGGEPLASDIPGREDEECFPSALVAKYDRRGKPTGRKAEPLAADLREGKGGRRVGFLKIVAGILGVGLDELVQREQLRRQRRLAIIAGVSLLGMLVAIALAVVAIRARDEARDQRRQAEGLVEFMLGDLKNKLEPIGKLDALDGVGARVLQYYQNQDTSDLSDQALAQRSGALSLMAEVAQLRGQSDRALRLYREAMAGTAEALSRDPDNPQRLFDHAQNVFYIGQIAQHRGDTAGAEAAMRQYGRLAATMVELDPNNMKWRMEVQNADANLGAVLYTQRRFAEAADQTGQALQTIQALATADPRNRDYQQSLAESLAWYADAQRDAGHLDEAVALRQRQVALLDRLLSQSADVSFREKLVPAERSLGNLYRVRGQKDVAILHLRAAVDHANRLTAIEPENSKWLEYGLRARNDLADALLSAGSPQEGRQLNQSARETAGRLLAKDRAKQDLRAALRDCWLTATKLALASGSGDEALKDAQFAISAAEAVKGSDAIRDAYSLAQAYRLAGDARQRAGNVLAARDAWLTALRTLPPVRTERPSEMAEHLAILQRLGRAPEARPLGERLRAIGYNQAS